MKILRICLFLLVLPLFIATKSHKFYVSITKIEFVEEKQSLQLISKLFIDDLEDVLQQRYDASIQLATSKEKAEHRKYLTQYILQNLQIQVNGKPVSIDFIGSEYETDVIKIYMEVTGVSEVNTLEVSNEWLVDVFEEQQNIIHFKSDHTRRSMVLEKEHPTGMLNFN